MIRLDRSGDILTVVMDRPLDSAGAQALQQALRGKMYGVRHLVLDAGGTDVVDEEGLKVLRLLDERMLNVVDGTFRLVNLGDGARDLTQAEDWSDLYMD